MFQNENSNSLANVSNAGIDSAFQGEGNKLALQDGTVLDLSILPEKERNAILSQYANDKIQIDLKYSDLRLETAGLRATLDDLSRTTVDATERGNFVTSTVVHDGKHDRVEVMMGNTNQAEKGRLSKSQTGEKDWTPFYVFGGLATLIIIAAMLSR